MWSYISILYKKSPFIFWVTALLFSFLLGFIASRKGLDTSLFQSETNGTPFREKTESKYISPPLFCSESAPSKENKDLTNKMTKLINGHVREGSIDNASVYVRMLTTGEWAGVNEDYKYSPASLMKVAEMIAYFKEAESDPNLLSKKIYYGGIDKDANSFENFKPEKSIQKNTSYTIDELIDYMIKYSDNNAALVLNTLAEASLFDEIYSDLGLPFPPASNGGSTDYMSVKLFSRFFRVFYNATYLSSSLSEKAIKLLLKAKFPEGIAGGIPEGIEVASKFGERTVLKQDVRMVNRELHDCGIVYAQKEPYLLCIMTKGKDLSALSSIIRDISSLVYKEVGSK